MISKCEHCGAQLVIVDSILKCPDCGLNYGAILH